MKSDRTRTLSVVVCTHNPRPDFMERVLTALRQQELPLCEWELILVDNRSDEPLSSLYQIDWHPHGRHIREEELGLTAANLRGIQEAGSDAIIFVHDDNLLAPDYLRAALQILNRMPWVGAFNGSTLGEYEVPLPEWASMMPIQLAVREIKKAAWGCLPGTQSLPFAPVGAGMVIRKTVAVHYAHKVRADKVRLALGRKGGVLSSGEDSDMAYCACELGYAVGVFPELSLVHMMPKERLERSYLLRLAEGMAFSHSILGFIWDDRMPSNGADSDSCRSAKLFNAYARLRSRIRQGQLRSFNEEFEDASRRGASKARDFILSLQA